MHVSCKMEVHFPIDLQSSYALLIATFLLYMEYEVKVPYNFFVNILNLNLKCSIDRWMTEEAERRQECFEDQKISIKKGICI